MIGSTGEEGCGLEDVEAELMPGTCTVLLVPQSQMMRVSCRLGEEGIVGDGSR
jgi:hypothetical protein